MSMGAGVSEPIAEEGNSELNGTFFNITFSMFLYNAAAIRTVIVRRLVFAIRTGVRIIR